MPGHDDAMPPHDPTPAWLATLATTGLPRVLDWLRADDDGRAWLAGLPGAVREVAADWNLALGALLPGGMVSLVAEATRAGGTPAVLKIQVPSPESAHEADALRAWDGNGAVRLFDHDPGRNALLLERAEPGTPLSDVAAAGRPGEALAALEALLPRLWLPAAPPFGTLEAEAARWLATMEAEWERAGRPWERRLLDAAVDALITLAPTQGEQVLVNQDLHGGNVLRATREPWLVIDPKPLTGEREFGLAPLIRSWELGHSRAAVIGRLDRLSASLGLDRERARLWAIGQTVAWSCAPDYWRPHIESARWLLDA